MKYFLISEEKEWPLPYFTNWYSTIPPAHLAEPEKYKVPRIIHLRVKLDKELEFMEVLSHPYFMVSKEFSFLLRMYEPQMKFRYVVLNDRDNQRSLVYAMRTLPVIDCLAEGSEYNLDRSVLRKGIIHADKVDGHHLFQLGGLRNRYVAASLELVESAFRREVMGMHIEELEII